MIISKKNYDYLKTVDRIKDKLIQHLVKIIADNKLTMPQNVLEAIEELYTKKEKEKNG